jgi:hypothetical protein
MTKVHPEDGPLDAAVAANTPTDGIMRCEGKDDEPPKALTSEVFRCAGLAPHATTRSGGTVA